MSALYRNLKTRLCGFNGVVRVREGAIVVAVGLRDPCEVCFLNANETSVRCASCMIVLLTDGRIAMATLGNSVADSDLEKI